LDLRPSYREQREEGAIARDLSGFPRLFETAGDLNLTLKNGPFPSGGLDSPNIYLQQTNFGPSHTSIMRPAKANCQRVK
jgi:hypothetical protein